MATGYVPGVRDPNATISPSTGPATTNTFGSPNTFSSAVNTQGSDYDRIMKSYEDLLKSSSGDNPALKPITPSLTNFKQSDDVTNSLKNLSDLSANGGYSDSAIGDIRARDIAPIRSIYASAQAGLDRSKSLQGGYSPNYAATTAKLSRELSDQIGKKTTDVNAGIAQQQAQNRLSIAPSWASASQSADSARTAIDKSNADTINQINEFNANLVRSHNTDQQSIIDSMRSLYGTTPALVNTFGGQVSQAAQLGQGQQQINNNKSAQSLAAARGIFG